MPGPLRLILSLVFARLPLAALLALTMPATGGRRFTLEDLLRKGPVALFFYPGNNTPG